MTLKPFRLFDFSGECPNNYAKYILNTDSEKSWKCKNESSKKGFIEIQLHEEIKISKIEIKNCGSAFVEVQVSRSKDSIKGYQVLMISTSLLTSSESIKSDNLSGIKEFTLDNFTSSISSQKWDRIKLVCSQPFNSGLNYGLNYVRIYKQDDTVQTIHASRNDVPHDNKSKCSQKINISDFLKPDFDDIDPLDLFQNRNKLYSTDKADAPTVAMKTYIKPISQTVSEIPTQISNNSDDTQILNENSQAASTQPLEDNATMSIKVDDQTQLLNSQAASTKPLEDNATMTIKVDDQTQLLNESSQAASTQSLEGDTQILEDKELVQLPVKNHISVEDISVASTSFANKPTLIQTNTDRNEREEDIMKNVVFVLSGYQNPLRNHLREKAIKMGAKYEVSWNNNTCTHLICAFPNTPKFKEVSGKGFIVSDKWITDSYRLKSLQPWHQYNVGSAPNPPKRIMDKFSEPKVAVKRKFQSESVTPTQTKPKVPKISKSDTLKTTNSGSSDSNSQNSFLVNHNEASTSNSSQKQLPSIFDSKHFFLYGNFEEKERNYLKRFIIAFGGIFHEYMGDEIDYVITYNNWDSNFDEALSSYSKLEFIRPSWLEECDEMGKMVSFVDHLVSRK